MLPLSDPLLFLLRVVIFWVGRNMLARRSKEPHGRGDRRQTCVGGMKQHRIVHQTCRLACLVSLMDFCNLHFKISACETLMMQHIVDVLG